MLVYEPPTYVERPNVASAHLIVDMGSCAREAFSPQLTQQINEFPPVQPCRLETTF